MGNLIHESHNYNQFKIIDFNRSVCKKNLDKIIDLNKQRKRFHLFPIVVDKDFNIIDGQHRFEACRKLNEPIHYVVDLEKEDHWDSITQVNTAGKTHGTTDVYTMLLKKGDYEASRIHVVNERYPTISPGSLCYYFITNYTRDKSVLRVMQMRQHKIFDYEKKVEVLDLFYSHFGYFKSTQCRTMFTVIRKLEIKNLPKYFTVLKNKGFMPASTWSVSTFKENLYKAHNKGLHKNRLAL